MKREWENKIFRYREVCVCRTIVYAIAKHQTKIFNAKPLVCKNWTHLVCNNSKINAMGAAILNQVEICYYRINIFRSLLYFVISILSMLEVDLNKVKSNVWLLQYFVSFIIKTFIFSKWQKVLKDCWKIIKSSTQILFLRNENTKLCPGEI